MKTRVNTFVCAAMMMTGILILLSGHAHARENLALSFDGSDDYVDMGKEIDLTRKSFSIEAWIKPEAYALGTHSTLISDYVYADNQYSGFSLQLLGQASGSAGKLVLKSPNDSIMSEGVLELNRWHHVCVRFQYDPDGNHRVDLNGGGEITKHGFESYSRGTAGFLIGREPGENGGNFSFTGKIDEVRIWTCIRLDDRRLSGIENSLRVYYDFDTPANPAPDSSPVAYDGTLFGMDVATAFVATPDLSLNYAYPDEFAFLFDGKDDYITVEAIDLADRSFTIECWARSNTGTILYQSSADDPPHQLELGFTFDGSFIFSIDDVSIQRKNEDHAWHHWAAVYDSEKKEMKLYQDGEQAGSATSESLQASGLLYIGKYGNQGNYFKGELEEVAVWYKVRTQEEIKANKDRKYRGSERGLAAYWRLNDASGVTAFDTALGHDGVLHNMTAQTARTYGIYLDEPLIQPLALKFEPQKFIDLPDEPAFDFTSAFTVEFWLRIDQWNKDNQVILSKGDNAWEFRRDGNTNKIAFFTSGMTSEKLVSSQDIEPGRWYHLACVLDGTAKYIYLDGTLDKSEKALDGDTGQNDTPVRVGAHPLNPGFELSGTLDELRIWNIARSEAMISECYNRKLWGNEQGLVGWWNFNEPDQSEAKDSSNAERHGTLSDPFALSDFVDGIDNLKDPASGDYGLYFDGTDDHINFGSSINLANQSFTLEFWAKRDSVDKKHMIFGQGTMESNKRLSVGFRADNIFTGSFYLNDIETSEAYNDKDWHHWALVYDSSYGVRQIFRDGALIAEQTGVSPYQGAGNFYVGFDGQSGYFHGWLDEVRIWNTVRTEGEISFYMNRPLPEDPQGLTMHADFGGATGDTVADLSGKGNDGVIMNQDTSGIRPEGVRLTGSELPAGINLSPNPDMAGLWIGQVEINKVNEVTSKTDTQTPTDAPNPFDMTLLLHADDNGQVRLIRDITLMQKRYTEQENGEDVEKVRKVLITNKKLLPEYEGVVNRDGKMVGIRMGSLAFDFDPDKNELALMGGLGAGYSVVGNIVLAKTHPTNPFRHKYHPDHKNDGNSGFTVIREFILTFDEDQGTDPEAGITKLVGRYEETVRGIHKIALKGTGKISMKRISTIERLNDK